MGPVLFFGGSNEAKIYYIGNFQGFPWIHDELATGSYVVSWESKRNPQVLTPTPIRP